jgi:hypothetical protein
MRRGIAIALVLALAAPAGAAELTEEWQQRWVGPADDVEQLVIDNRLGAVEVRGWERSEVQIAARKRAASAEVLARLRVHVTKYDDGRMVVDTRVKLENGELLLPLGTSQTDLVVNAPRGVRLSVRTWAGDVRASGMHGGARLETDGGRVDASDLEGAVVTRGRRSNQRITYVHGDLDVDDLEGEVELKHITGDRVVARLLRGTLRAERVAARSVSLQALMGRVEYILDEDEAVELRARTHDGGRLTVDGRAQDGDLFHGVFGGGRIDRLDTHIELASFGGDIWIQHAARVR